MTTRSRFRVLLILIILALIGVIMLGLSRLAGDYRAQMEYNTQVYIIKLTNDSVDDASIPIQTSKPWTATLLGEPPNQRFIETAIAATMTAKSWTVTPTEVK